MTGSVRAQGVLPESPQVTRGMPRMRSKGPSVVERPLQQSFELRRVSPLLFQSERLVARMVEHERDSQLCDDMKRDQRRRKSVTLRGAKSLITDSCTEEDRIVKCCEMQ